MVFSLTNQNKCNVLITLKPPKCYIQNSENIHATMNITIFLFVCACALDECLYGGAGVNVQLSSAAFPALWGCCQQWSIRIFVLQIWKEDAVTYFNFSWECAISCASSHGASSLYRNRGCLSFPLLDQPNSVWAAAPGGYPFGVAK